MSLILLIDLNICLIFHFNFCVCLVCKNAYIGVTKKNIYNITGAPSKKFRDCVALVNMRAASSGSCYKLRYLHLSSMRRTRYGLLCSGEFMYYLKAATTAHVPPIVVMWKRGPRVARLIFLEMPVI